MTTSGWEYDGRLLADLRAALPGRTPGPTDHYTELAVAAFQLGRDDGPTGLAELVFDSACDPEPAGLTRSSGTARLLAFRAAGYTLDVEIGDDGLLGQLHPDGSGSAPAGSVSAQTVEGMFGEAPLDEVGGFTLPLPPPGPMRLKAQLGGLTVVTSWLVLRYPTQA
jgi:hypothetical protein